MAVPKKRTSSSKSKQRRAHGALKKIIIVYDKNTGEPKLPHHVSLEDGFYNGKVMLKKEKKAKTSEEKGKKE